MNQQRIFMLKTFLQTKNLIISIVILVLLVANALALIGNQKTKQAALTVAHVAEIRSALSIYAGERGVYPEGAELLLGGTSARILCIPATDARGGFLADGVACGGREVFDFSKIEPLSSFVYTSSGARYSLEFKLQTSFGAFTRKGYYCAMEQGIEVGKCQQ